MYCFAKFCRLCLQRSDTLLDFKTKDADNITIINKIMTLMPSLILSKENFPTLICEKCHHQLNNSYNFINSCFKTNEQLVKYSCELNFVGNKSNYNLDVSLDKLGEKTNSNDVVVKIDENVDEKADEKYILKMNGEATYTITINVDGGEEGGKKNSDAEDHAVNQVADAEDHAEIQVAEADVKAENSNNDADDDNKIYVVNISNNLGENSGAAAEKKSFVCGTCGKTFGTKPNLKRHYENVHLNIRYNCQICSKQFTQMDSLRYHERIVHLNLRKYKCDYCERMFAEPLHLKLHQKRCKKKRNNERRAVDNDNDDDEDDDEEPRLVIDETPTTASSSGTSPAVVVDPKLPHRCTVCKKSFASKPGLKNHYTFVHLEGRHRCGQCRERYLTFKELRAHRNLMHPTKKRFGCEVCGVQFATKPMLADHRAVHEVHACDLCPRAFPTAAVLQLHRAYEHKVDEDRAPPPPPVVSRERDDNEDEEMEAMPKIEEIVVEEVVIKKEEYLLPD